MKQKWDSVRKAFVIGVLLAARSTGQTAEDEIRLRAAKSVDLLLKTSKTWFDKQSCPSCHHQDLPMMVFNLARHRGVVVDQTDLQQVVTKTLTSALNLTNLDQLLQGSDVLNPATIFRGRLIAAAPLGLPQTLATGTIARLIARRQRPDGHWRPGDDKRPPQSFSPFTTTADALRAIQLFFPKTMAQERQRRIEQARLWLERTAPIDTEDRVYQLLGLSWAASKPEIIAKFRDELFAEQREDGGWGQIPDRSSDAYATGEALTALNQAAGVATSHPAFQRGLRYLLKTQAADGSWFVKTRLNPPAPLSPPYFDSGFPYGHDQFISAMGTCWAASALLLAVPESTKAPQPLNVSAFKPVDSPAWAETVLFGDMKDLRTLIASGWNVNSATTMGTTALMMAAPDVDKVSLLLKSGADSKEKSKTRYTALMIAASHHATDSVRILLDHQAEVKPLVGQPVQFGSTPLILAVLSGDIETMQALRTKGATAQTTMLAGGFFPVTPLSVAVQQGDLAMVEALIRGGILVDEIASPADGVTSIGWSVLNNDKAMAKLLIGLGADVNHVDKLGYTPLLWAASIEFVDSEMLELLLQSGAHPVLKNNDGFTALQLATRYGYIHHQKVLSTEGQ